MFILYRNHLKKADRLFLVGTIIFLMCVPFFGSALEYVKRRFLDLRYLKNYLLKNKKLVFISLILLIGFHILYSSIGLSLASGKAFSADDLVFEIDVNRVVGDITSFSANHYRTKVHPLYVLMINPIGTFVSKIFFSNMTTAILLNSLLGSFGVVLAFMFFYLFGKNYTNSLLLALVFGLSMSQLVFGSVPDTSSLGILSLLTTYILFLVSLKRKKIYFSYWVFAGVFSLGVTTTNVVQTMICFIVLISVLYSEKNRIVQVLSRTAILSVTVIIVTVCLAIIQKLIYPSSNLFYAAGAYNEEFKYASLLILKEPVFVISIIAKHFFLVNIVAPLPSVFEMSNTPISAITFSTSWQYSFIGWIGVVMWVSVLCSGIIRSITLKRDYFPIFVGVFFCLLFNCILHSYYGIIEKSKAELFLYTGNVTFLVLMFLSSYSHTKKTSIRVVLGLLLVIVAFNNMYVLSNILNIYQ